MRPHWHNPTVRRFALVFAAVLPALMVASLLLPVTAWRERVRRQDAAIAQDALTAHAAREAQLQSQLDAAERQNLAEAAHHAAQIAAMQAELESLHARLITASGQVTELQAELNSERTRNRAPVVSPAPTSKATSTSPPAPAPPAPAGATH